MEAVSIPELVRSNPKNEGFWRFEKQSKDTVNIFQMTHCYTEGHDKIFEDYGRSLEALCKWFIGYTAVLLNPETGEIFMQDYARFTFFLKYIPVPYERRQVFYGLDGATDITIMGPEWGNVIDEEFWEEDEDLVKNIYDSSNLQ